MTPTSMAHLTAPSMQTRPVFLQRLQHLFLWVAAQPFDMILDSS